MNPYRYVSEKMSDLNFYTERDEMMEIFWGGSLYVRKPFDLDNLATFICTGHLVDKLGEELSDVDN